MSDKPTDIATLVASRICHDLISPIGAIDNGIELIASMGQPATPDDMTILWESAQRASAKVQLFRIAFGQVKSGERMDSTLLLRLLTHGLCGPRVDVEWAPAAGTLSRTTAQALILALMCLEVALPIGGTLRITQHMGSIRASVEGPQVRHDPDLWDALKAKTPMAEPTSARLQFVLLPILGVAYNVTDREDYIMVTLGDED